jgi:hypothetical protein
MNRATDVTPKGAAERQPDAARLLANAGDVALVDRGVLRSIVIQCPDGCGDVITVNLDGRAGPAWRLYRRRDGTMTLYPSVWRDSGCGAHFIVWRDKILWCDRDDDVAWHDHKLRIQILDHLPPADMPPLHFEDLAAALAESPWDVLWECRAMARAGLAVSSDKNRKFVAAPKRSKAKGDSR